MFLNYLNTASLIFNSIVGILAVCYMNTKMSLFYYVATNYILKVNIVYQIIRLILIFSGEIIISNYIVFINYVNSF
jgi:hypothetical protein